MLRHGFDTLSFPLIAFAIYKVYINVELKNSRESYSGMEEKILKLVKIYGLEEHIIYSSFSGDSLKRLKGIEPNIKVGILKGRLSECLSTFYQQGGEASHPYVDGLDVEIPEDCKVQVVRGWSSSELFYGQGDRQNEIYDLLYASKKGVTDFITNVLGEHL